MGAVSDIALLLLEQKGVIGFRMAANVLLSQ